MSGDPRERPFGLLEPAFAKEIDTLRQVRIGDGAWRSICQGNKLRRFGIGWFPLEKTLTHRGRATCVASRVEQFGKIKISAHVRSRYDEVRRRFRKFLLSRKPASEIGP